VDKLLIVDDDSNFRSVLSALFRGNYHITEAESAAALEKVPSDAQPDVVLLDVGLPDADGLDLLLQLKRRWPETEVIILTGCNDISKAVEAGKRGAFNFVAKPFENAKLLADVRCALDYKRQREESALLRRALETMSGAASPIFQSQSMRQVVRTVERVGPSDVPILITGESGTGKEVIADLIHAFSPRAKRPIIKINCAALPRELIESELFGSVKGAFTGAHSDREGLFRQAEGGTLLLDEISEMAVDTQSKLLRVLQDQEIRPVGGRVSHKTNCRIIAATNRRPEDAIRDGKLREDLFYRISAISIHLPPLRERREDVMPLANAFLKRYSAQAGQLIRDFTPEAVECLAGFAWPGNIRQLQNEVQRAVLLCSSDRIAASDLSITKPSAQGEEDTDNASFTIFEGVERNTIIRTLKDTGGNKLETAKRLGIGHQTLRNKIKAYAIAA
jgi:DNA-binding NtrC family response regulator